MSNPKLRTIQIITAAIFVVLVITLFNALSSDSSKAWSAVLANVCALVVGLIGWWQVKNEQKRQGPR